MHSNIFLTTLKDENINLKNNQKVNVYLVSQNNDNVSKTLNIELRKNNEVNLYCLILGNNVTKTFNFNFNHLGNNSVSNIYVKSLANNNAHLHINCISFAKQKTHKNEINQLIDGLIFDNESSIQALPCLDIDVNDIVAKHTVNIGQVDPEIIFYLNTKGLSKTEAYQFMIDSFISLLKPYLDQYHLNIDNDIKSLMEGK